MTKAAVCAVTLTQFSTEYLAINIPSPQSNVHLNAAFRSCRIVEVEMLLMFMCHGYNKHT